MDDQINATHEAWVDGYNSGFEDAALEAIEDALEEAYDRNRDLWAGFIIGMLAGGTVAAIAALVAL